MAIASPAMIPIATKEALLRPDLAGVRLREVVVFLAVRLRGAAIILNNLRLITFARVH